MFKTKGAVNLVSNYADLLWADLKTTHFLFLQLLHPYFAKENNNVAPEHCHILVIQNCIRTVNMILKGLSQPTIVAKRIIIPFFPLNVMPLHPPKLTMMQRSQTYYTCRDVNFRNKPLIKGSSPIAVGMWFVILHTSL